MILDVNAYLGPFAFRRLRHNQAGSMLELMDRKGIDKAIVSSASAITYRNTQPANEDLAAEVASHRDRLIPFGVVNPFYAGWRDDLKACHETLGMKGLRLYPGWHHYKLADASCHDLIQDATERGMLISIPLRVEDARNRSWLVDVPDVPHAEVLELIKAFPKARFILINGLGFVGGPLGKKDNGLPENYQIEISRIDSVLGNEMGRLIDNLGPSRVVFGTGMPFSYPDPALLKLEVLKASQDVKDQILAGNAAKWLGLDT